MAYIPPRGPCAYKTSLMSPTCACLRFMIHPVKAATSFECDGCSHHASFHKMENKEEDELLSKWRTVEASKGHEMSVTISDDEMTTAPVPKRRRLGTVREQDNSVITSRKVRRSLLRPRGEPESG